MPSDDGARLRLLGGWSLDGVAGAGRLPQTVRRVLTLLALRGPTTREVLAAALWPDASAGHSHGSLRTTLWRLRALPAGLVDADAETVRLAAAVAVDVHELAEDVRRLDAGVLPARLRGLTDTLVAGELAPGLYDEWLHLDRERVRQLRLHALEGLALGLAAEGRWALALEAALGAVRVEPLRESAHRVVVRVHLLEGNRSEALRHGEEYGRLLAAELGVAPSPALAGLLAPPVPAPRPAALSPAPRPAAR